MTITEEGSQEGPTSGPFGKHAAGRLGMRPTDIGNPDYFHKVVDCQWACPAHTPVPEYIRLIAAGRYTDAYMVNWYSNVFPGILGRTCDRPCEPACRRGRVEEEPVAICRLKRVAADNKDDITGRLPHAGKGNGKRVALIGAGPASLTVARDLAPLGYQLTLDRLRHARRRNDPQPDPPLPSARVGHRRRGRLHPRYGRDRDALRRRTSIASRPSSTRGSTRSSSAPARRAAVTSIFRGATEASANIHIGIDWLSSVSFEHIDKIGRRVIVLGGGNTAMDCCRTSRRLGGNDVKVIVRSGFEEMKASPWEKEDAMHEGIPILNYLVPKEFTHDAGKLTGVLFEKVAAHFDDEGRRRLEPTGEPDVHFECDDVLIAIGQENAFPWIERDLGLAFDRRGHAEGRCRDAPVDPPARFLRRRLRRSARRTSSGPLHMDMRRRSRSTSIARERTCFSARRRM